MPYYEWRGSGVFQDNRNDREIEHGDVVELPESVVGNHDFVEVDEPEETGETPTPDADESDGNEDETPLAEKEYSELREMAVEADTDEVNGRSSKDEIIAYFSE